MPRAARVILLLLLITTTGCHHAGTVPPGWDSQPITAAEHAEPDTGELQVIICYGKVLSNHTALRLTAPGKPDLLWDPGGTYLQHEPAHARTHDVITRDAPTLDQWWRYRRDGCREPVMEVFHWSLEPDQAERLHAILTGYRDPNDPTQTFEPDAGGLQCCTKVSEFLMRFAEGRPGIHETMFWPHKLGEHLWSQQPDHVDVYRAQGPSLRYLQNTNE